ncbi:MAG: hypothetical protein EP297_05835 [Gammaproteobacteria bacterium]|nr:MAG: hypothetical protein EP297_05835 [Gammaproteobacteria bacterium]
MMQNAFFSKITDNKRYRVSMLFLAFCLLLLPYNNYAMPIDSAQSDQFIQHQSDCHTADQGITNDDAPAVGCCCGDISSSSCHCLSSVALAAYMFTFGSSAVDSLSQSILLNLEGTSPPLWLRPPKTFQI